MKTRWYFIIASAAVVGFAAWYQDHHRDDTARRQRIAEEEAHTREVEHARKRQQQIDDDKIARKFAEVRRIEGEAQAQRQAAEQAQRDEWRSQLAAVRDENAALHGQRDRLTREVDDGAARIARAESEHAGVTREIDFLEDYISQARGSVARIAAVVEKVANMRNAAGADTVDTTEASNQRVP